MGSQLGFAETMITLEEWAEGVSAPVTAAAVDVFSAVWKGKDTICPAAMLAKAVGRIL